MQFSIILSLAALLTTAIAAPIDLRSTAAGSDPDVFTLFGDSRTWNNLLLGDLEYPGARPGAGSLPSQVGWPAYRKSPRFYGFVQYNEKQGQLFYANNTALQLYAVEAPLKDGPSLYKVMLGNPESEKDQSKVLYKDWKIVSATGDSSTKPILTYKGQSAFYSCGTMNFGLYFNPATAAPVPRMCAKTNLLVDYI